MNLKFIVIFFFVVFIDGCSHGDKISSNALRISGLEDNFSSLKNDYFSNRSKIDSLEGKINSLKKVLVDLEKGILENQMSLQNDLSNLHSEGESEFNRINEYIGKIKRKTDQFDIKHSDGAMLFIPRDMSKFITLIKKGSWYKSGGRSSSHKGNIKYAFDVSQKADVTITLESSKSADAYLLLLNKGGDVLRENDDFGSVNSKIEMELDEGSYLIVAATYNSGKKADFILTLNGFVENLRSSTSYFKHYLMESLF